MATATAKKSTRKPAAKPAPAAPASGHTPARHVRFPDSEWEAGNENAKRDGFTGISELLRQLLRDYNAGKRMG
jgi:hypothetical protein